MPSNLKSVSTQLFAELSRQTNHAPQLLTLRWYVPIPLGYAARNSSSGNSEAPLKVAQPVPEGAPIVVSADAPTGDRISAAEGKLCVPQSCALPMSSPTHSDSIGVSHGGGYRHWPRHIGRLGYSVPRHHCTRVGSYIAVAHLEKRK